jgi:hypothetical protein
MRCRSQPWPNAPLWPASLLTARELAPACGEQRARVLAAPLFTPTRYPALLNAELGEMLRPRYHGGYGYPVSLIMTAPWS